MDRTAMAHDSLADRLLDAALRLGEQHGWEAMRLHQLADAANVSLLDVQGCYRQKDELVDAWFDRADRAMLTAAAQLPSNLNPRQRLQHLLWQWLASIAPHRTLTREMLAYKFEFGHVHLQVDALLRISRTVQWWREAAARDQHDLARVLDELSLSSIFVSSFLLFLNDPSPDQQRTRDWLHTTLFVQEGLGRALPSSPFTLLSQSLQHWLNQKKWTR